MSEMWAKTRRARIAHHYRVCEVCQGKGWLLNVSGHGPFGLAIDPEPCLHCGGSEADYDAGPYGGSGYFVACGWFNFGSEIVPVTPEAERCRRCRAKVGSSSIPNQEEEP